MGVNSLHKKTVTRQRRDCDLNPGRTAFESSTLTTRLRSHPRSLLLLLSGLLPTMTLVFSVQRGAWIRRAVFQRNSRSGQQRQQGGRYIIRYDTRCYFNVRSFISADDAQLSRHFCAIWPSRPRCSIEKNDSERVKLGSSFSWWAEITGGVPRGSWLGPLIFVILLSYGSNLCVPQFDGTTIVKF